MSGRTPPLRSRLGTARGGHHDRPRSQASRSSRPAAPPPSEAVRRPPAVLHRRRRPRRPRRPQLGDELTSFTDQPTAAEMEELFFRSLAAGLPEHFSLTPETEPARMLPSAEPRLVLGSGSGSGSGYWELFGVWSEAGGYRDGLIVATLRRLESRLNPAAATDIDTARDHLAEAVIARRQRLSEASANVRRRHRAVCEVMAMEGTRLFLQSLVDRLNHRIAAAPSDL